MSALATALVAALLLTAAPHLFPLHRTAPVTGAAVWMLALLLRAVVVVGVTTFLAARLAHTALLEATLNWCWHSVLPDIPARLGFAEHPVAHAAVAVPLFAMTGALAVQALRGLRAWIELRRRLSGAWSFDRYGTAVLPGDELIVAVTRVGRGRVVVSDRALEAMDDHELAAGLAHEFAHLHRRHRPCLLLAALLATIGRPLPGPRAAQRELCFQFERDADAWAVSRLHDPLSLASAICKTAVAAAPRGTAGLAGRGPVTRRLAELVGERGIRSSRVEGIARALAVAMAATVIGLAVAAPAWAGTLWDPHSPHMCSHR
jgi:hypothetical protein